MKPSAQEDVQTEMRRVVSLKIFFTPKCDMSFISRLYYYRWGLEYEIGPNVDLLEFGFMGFG